MARIAMTLLLATCVAAAGATAVPQQAKQGLPVLPRRGGFKKAVQPKVCMFSQRLLMVAWEPLEGARARASATKGPVLSASVLVCDDVQVVAKPAPAPTNPPAVSSSGSSIQW